MNLKELLGDPVWLFDLGFPIRSFAHRIPSPEKLEWQLSPDHAIPALGSLSGGLGFAKTYLAWTGTGFYIQAKLTNLSSADAGKYGSITTHLTFYIDTRWSPDVLRATSYCHRFDFHVDRPSATQPTKRGHGELSAIQRARSAPADVHPSQLCVGSFLQTDGYEIKAYIPADALTGYAPDEYLEIGVFYSLHEPFMGNQLMARTQQCPYFENPSLWCRAKLHPTLN